MVSAPAGTLDFITSKIGRSGVARAPESPPKWESRGFAWGTAVFSREAAGGLISTVRKNATLTPETTQPTSGQEPTPLAYGVKLSKTRLFRLRDCIRESPIQYWRYRRLRR